MLQVESIVDKKIWETFLEHAPTTSSYPFFQSWNWSEVQRLLGNTTYHLGLFDNNKLVAMALVVEVKAKRGHYLYLRHGPVFFRFNQDYFSFFLNEIKKIAKKSKCSFIRVSRFPKTETVTEEFFKKNKFIKAAIQTIDAEVCWVLDVTKPQEELLRNMRKSHRYLIKKAATYDLKIIKTTNTEDLGLFLPLYKDLSKKKHFVPHKGLKEEFEVFKRDNQCMLFLAKFEGKVIAGAFIDFVGKTAIYRHASSDKNYNHIPASYLIQWAAIEEAKKRNMKVYNFWGIAPPDSVNHPWKGITLFKTGFGGDYEYFVPTMDLPLSFSYAKNYAIDFVSKLRKGH